MKQQQQELDIQTNDAAKAVGDYRFEPIRGKPMLKWDGKRPFIGTHYFPAQEKERHGNEGPDGWMNRIYWGDNLQVMSHLLKEFRGKVNLIYIDPPFDSKADYKKKISLRGKKVESDHSSFEDKQYTDIWTNDEYLQFMYERLILCRELLAENGSIYLHMDEKRSHYLKCIMDEVFGSENFQREIIWRIGWISGYKSAAKNWIRNHDVILFYSKSSTFEFNKEYIPYPEGYTRRDGAVPTGKGYPIEDTWNCSDMDRLDSIQIMSFSSEKVGYPTQKNENLLSRIIKASSNPGDIVFDCFMGSGTTQAVAMKLGRKFIGADINLGAIQTTTKRLLAVAKELGEQLPDSKEAKYTGFTVYNVNNYDVFRNPVEARDLLVQALELQPLPKSSLYDGEKDGAFYKIMPVNRLATKADLNEIVMNFDYKAAEKKQNENPGQPVLELKLVCMGHEPDLKASLEEQLKGFKVDIEVIDILRDKSDLVFKRDSEADIVVKGKKLKIKAFYPMNLLKKLSIQKQDAKDWKELVESVMIDFNYDGAVFTPTVVDVPKDGEFVKGEYDIPDTAGTIKVKITDLLSESLEAEVK